MSLFRTLIPVSILFVSLLNTAALAQPGFQQQKDPNAPKRKKGDYRAKYQPKASELPGIPTYPDKNMKLLRAVSLPNLGQGNITILQSFLVKDPPEQVRDYYAQQLQDNKWAARSGNRTNTQLQGNRNGNESCQIMVNPSYPGKQGKGFKTMLQIRYTKAGTSIN